MGLPVSSLLVELQLIFSKSELMCVFTAPLLVRGKPENATIEHITVSMQSLLQPHALLPWERSSSARVTT